MNDKLLAALDKGLRGLPADKWRAESIKEVIKQTAVDHGVKFPQVGMLLREITGRTNSPDIAEVAVVLGKENVLVSLVDYYINHLTIYNDLLAVHCYDDELLAALDKGLRGLPADEWEAESIKQSIKDTADEHGVKFTKVEMPLRVLLTGRVNSPDIVAVAVALGRQKTLESLRRIEIIRKHEYPDPPGGIVF